MGTHHLPGELRRPHRRDVRHMGGRILGGTDLGEDLDVAVGGGRPPIDRMHQPVERHLGADGDEDVLGPGQPLRFSKELTRTNALQLENYHSLNVRVDYRRTLGPVDLVAFVDVVNVIGTGANTLEFDPRRGENVLEEFDAFPIIGIILERSW